MSPLNKYPSITCFDSSLLHIGGQKHSDWLKIIDSDRINRKVSYSDLSRLISRISYYMARNSDHAEYSIWHKITRYIFIFITIMSMNAHYRLNYPFMSENWVTRLEVLTVQLGKVLIRVSSLWGKSWWWCVYGRKLSQP